MCKPSSDTRAVSEVLGYILIFSLIFATVGIVSIAGLPTLEDARESQQLQNAERAFDVLNSNMIEVYDRGAPSRATELSADDGTVETGEAVTFNVTVIEGGDRNSTEVEINPIIFTGFGETEFVYEAGAVLRDSPSGGIMLREPPLKISDDRVLIPLIATNSDRVTSVGGGTVLVRASSRSRSVEIAEESSQIEITVANSDHQDIWQTYFEEEAGMSCTGGTTLDCDRSVSSAQAFVTIQKIDISLEV